nr:PREDICTED: ABC transporter G family member 20-like [Bemisia tabaci]
MVASPGERDVAVRVEKAFKSYGSSHVLKGLDLTVLEGTIYGLLGPSGCGKTTLLSCIIGRSRLDDGSVRLKARRLKDVGFMPQELALHFQLSMQEVFTYYGYVFGLSDREIRFRVDTLVQMLQLPPITRLISDLSGGQQRRVSLAVALLHNPSLLILDEPTVGLDPVLSKSIWERLVEMAKEGKTIIITTHYIEEARQAHTIGLMRYGKLLAEDSPNKLLEDHNTNNLEDVFLALCRRDEAAKEFKWDSSFFSRGAAKPTMPLQNNSNFNTSRFKAQFLKNIYLLMRNIPMLLFTFMLPIIVSVFFSLAVGHDPRHLAFGVVNSELDNSLINCPKVYPTDRCIFEDNITISCAFIKEIQGRDYRLHEYSNLDNAILDYRTGKTYGLIHFGSNYTEAVQERVKLQKDASNLAIEQSFADLWLDSSNLHVLYQMQRDFYNGIKAAFKKILKPCANESETAAESLRLPITMERPVFGSYDYDFSTFCTPGLVIIAVFYLPTVFTTGIIGEEKESGVMERVMSSGITFLEVALSHVIVQMTILVIQIVELLAIIFFVFGQPFKGDPTLAFALLVVVGSQGMLFGIILSITSKNLTAAGFAGIGSNFLLMLICGFFWALEGAHYSIQLFNRLVPLTQPIISFRAITMRYSNIFAPEIFKGFVSAMIWNVIFLVFIYLFMKLRKDLWKVKG